MDVWLGFEKMHLYGRSVASKCQSALEKYAYSEIATKR